MLRSAGAWLGLGALLLGGGCLGPRAEIASPSAGGNAWEELKSEHFLLVTDLQNRDAERVLAEYERTYALLASATHVAYAARAMELPSFQTHAVTFRDLGELQPFIPAQMVGVYRESLPNEIEAVPTILASGTLSPFGRVTLAHELAHRFNHVALGSMPVWLNEGLAQYYSTIRGEVNDPVIGESDPENVVAAGSVRHSVGDVVFQGGLIHAQQLPAASDLIALDAEGFYAESTQNHAPLTFEAKNTQARNYAAAWMLVHLLMHEPFDYAERFRDELAKPDGFSTGAKLQAVLAQVDSVRLDRDFRAYLLKSIPWRQYHPGSSPRPELSTRALSDYEVSLWWARLDSFKGERARQASRRLADAQHASPNAPDVQFWLGRAAAMRGDFKEAGAAYESAVAAAPDRPELLLGLVTLYGNREANEAFPDHQARLEQALTKLAPIARTPLQLNVLAMQALFTHDAQKAAGLAQKARTLGADCWECWHTAAAAALVNGDAAQAVELERAARARAPESLPEDARHVLDAALRSYQEVAQNPQPARHLTLPPMFLPD